MQADMMVNDAKTKADLMIKEAEAKKNQADEYVKNLLDKHKTDSAERVAMAKIASDQAIAMDKTKHDYLKHQANTVSDSIMAVDEAKKMADEAKLAGKAQSANDNGKSKPNGKSAPKTIKTNVIRDPKTGDMMALETVL